MLHNVIYLISLSLQGISRFCFPYSWSYLQHSGEHHCDTFNYYLGIRSRCDISVLMMCIHFWEFWYILVVYMEKAMAPHSSTLAWKIPWTEEPGGLQSTGSQRVGHDWATSLSLFTFTNWRRKWQPTPVFLPGESQGRGSLVGCCLWGRIESDMTEAT